MLLEQANALSRYWARFPPMHELGAAYFGLGKSEEPTRRPEVTRADLQRLDELSRKWGLA